MDRPANGTAAASTSSPCTVAAVSASPPGRRPVSASAGSTSRADGTQNRPVIGT